MVGWGTGRVSCFAPVAGEDRGGGEKPVRARSLLNWVRALPLKLLTIRVYQPVRRDGVSLVLDLVVLDQILTFIGPSIGIEGEVVGRGRGQLPLQLNDLLWEAVLQTA
ncbi:hypothetical protein J2Y66_003696 [Paenarthrobacter nitroguajacolicus]|nr:hypothetical protein [Paenarthrobacter nitroguajacolicus]